MKILVPILAPLGDTLFTTPSLKALRNRYPDARIDVLAWKSTKDILEGNNNIDNLILAEGTPQLIAKIKKLRETIYDYIIGLSNVGSYIGYLLNSQKKLGFLGSDNKWMYDFRVPDNRNIHAVDYCLEIVKLVGAVPDLNPRLELPVYTENRQKVIDILVKTGIKEKKLIAIHPGGKNFAAKRWPTEKFNKLVKLLDNIDDIQVILIGGLDDKEFGQEIIDFNYNYHNPPLNFCGELRIKETAALLENVNLFIGNDSSPQHMAAAVGTPVIALFGPTNPANFHPYGTEYIIIRKEDLDCSPCFFWLGKLTQYLPDVLPDWVSSCKRSCMEKIEVTDVIEKVRYYLDEYSLTHKKIITY